MQRLKGKVALITGSSRGIGKAIALAFGREGAKVAVCYNRAKEKAEEVAFKIKSMGSDATIVQLTVTDRASVRNAVRTVSDKFGCVDILVNNAGINKPTDFDKVTDEDWDEIMAVNLKGPYICTQEVLPIMRKSGCGNIINISSVSGQYGGPRTAHYAASKAGLISLGQVIARFGATYNIRCNTIAAGLIASEMGVAGMQSASVSTLAEGILLKRLGTPEEVADVVVFLASDESKYITAQTINVNGGLYF